MATSSIDLTGQQFGRLTALHPTLDRQGSSVIWECYCSCGNTAFVSAASLRNGRAKSCGCLQKEKARKDLTGQVFGLLTVVEPTEERHGRSVIWKCRCECGNTILVSSRNLHSGGTKSCGCAPRNDLAGQQFGLLTAVEPTEERRNGNVVWKCDCACGNTAYVSSILLKNGHTKSCGCLRLNDLSGQKFGLLTAVRPTEIRKKGIVVWECHCDCGNTTFVRAKDLNSGHTKSCGCLQKEKAKNDLSGQTFGMLTAIEPTEERRGGSVVWKCRCECGNTVLVSTKGLKSGHSQSCGCLQKTKARKDITGQQFGLLTAVEPTDERQSDGTVVWKCSCACGATTFVSTRDLNSGHTKSCGCLRKNG